MIIVPKQLVKINIKALKSKDFHPTHNNCFKVTFYLNVFNGKDCLKIQINKINALHSKLQAKEYSE